MYNTWFVIGLFSTLSLNSILTQVANSLFSAIVSIAGGVLSAITVAWLKKRWKEKCK